MNFARVLSLLAVLLLFTPATIAGNLVTTGSVCLPGVGERDATCVRPIGDKLPPNCIGVACDNPCLKAFMLTATSRTDVNNICGIPSGTDRVEKAVEDCAGDFVACGGQCAGIEPCPDASDVCTGVLPNSFCCLNSEGNVVDFELQGMVQGASYSVMILREMFANGDNQKDIRVGWNNQVVESRKGVTFELTSSKNIAWVDWPDGNPETGWYVPVVTSYVTKAVGTMACGLILYATNGGGVSTTATYGNGQVAVGGGPAIVQVKAWFSGLTVTEGKATTTGVTSSVSVGSETTKSRTWEDSISASYSATTGGSGGGSHTWGGSESVTHSYSMGTTATLEEGASVTFTPSEWQFDSAPFQI